MAETLPNDSTASRPVMRAAKVVTGSVPPVSVSGRGWYLAIAAITLGRGLAIAFLPPLLLEAPALLILISPAAADLVIAAPLLPAWLYFVSAMAGALIQTAIAYQFGRALGEHALLWLQSRSVAAKRGTRRVLGWLERASTVVMLATPGVTVSALAGVSGVKPLRFFTLIFIGNLLWTVACFMFGSALTEQLATLYEFVAAHVLELTAVAVVAVVLQLGWTRLRQRMAARQASGDD